MLDRAYYSSLYFLISDTLLLIAIGLDGGVSFGCCSKQNRVADPMMPWSICRCAEPIKFLPLRITGIFYSIKRRDDYNLKARYPQRHYLLALNPPNLRYNPSSSRVSSYRSRWVDSLTE